MQSRQGLQQKGSNRSSTKNKGVGRKILPRGSEAAEIPSADLCYQIAVIVPTDALGLIIGKHGDTFKEILSQTKAKLNIQPFSDIPDMANAREINISGSLENIFAAEDVILKRLQCRRPKSGLDNIHLPDGDVIIKCFIETSMCGALIGRDGEVIKSMNNESGAWIKVSHDEECTAGAVERLVYIRAPTESAATAARDMIFERVGGRPFTDKDMPSAVPEGEAETLLVPCGSYRYFQEKFSHMSECTGATFTFKRPEDFECGDTNIQLNVLGDVPNRDRGCATVREMLAQWETIHAKHTDMDVVLKIGVSSSTINGLINIDADLIRRIEDETSVAIECLQTSQSSSKTANHLGVLLIGDLSNIFKAQTHLLQEMKSFCLKEFQSVVGYSPGRVPSQSMSPHTEKSRTSKELGKKQRQKQWQHEADCQYTYQNEYNAVPTPSPLTPQMMMYPYFGAPYYNQPNNISYVMMPLGMLPYGNSRSPMMNGYAGASQYEYSPYTQNLSGCS